MNDFSITIFTEDFFWTIFVRRHDIYTTFATSIRMEFTGISLTHSLSMTYIWMFRWKRKMIFYVEDELLFYDFKWLFCDLARYDASEESIDVFLGNFITNDFLIILLYSKRRIKWTNVCIFIFSIMPTVSSCASFFF